MKFVSLSQFSEAEILETHNEAFNDYEVPMQISLETFKYLNVRRGVYYDLSIGAVEGNKLIGFILNAIDYWEGKLTAYDCGTGIIPKFRQKGIGTQIFNELLPILKEEQVEQYLLEVIQTNLAAIQLYKKRNFQITREFDCLKIERKQLIAKLKADQKGSMDQPYDIRNLDNSRFKDIKNFWDFSPSWQNSDLSIQRVPESFYYLGAFYHNEFIGYMVYEPNGGIVQIALHPNHRNQKIGSNFLEFMKNRCANVENFHIINVDTRNTNLMSFLHKFGFESFTTQYEMILKL